MIRTVLECSDTDFSVGLRDFLLKQPGFLISAELSLDLSSAQQIIQAEPDLVIVEMPFPHDFHVLDELKVLQPQIPVFFFCEQLTFEVERIVLCHKVDALFAKDEDFSVLVENAEALCRVG